MTLADFFAAIGPVLEGRAEVAEAVRAMYAREPARARDAERVAIYARFCAIHRFEVVDQVFVALRRAVIAGAGDQAWRELVESYFRAHPMRHVELNENGAAFPGYVAARAVGGALERWLAELADLEWWEWRTRIAPDEPEDPAVGPLRIAPAVELRPYAHDLIGWLDEHEPEQRPGSPGAGDQVVIFWRDRELEPRREPASPVELAALKLVEEGRADAAGARAIGLDPRRLDETIDDLHAAGILCGARR